MNIKEISISVEQEKSVSLEVSKSNEIGIGFEKREVLSEPRIERSFYDFDFTFNEEDGSLSLTLIQNNGVSKNLKIDLPTEELVKNVYYDNDNKEINIEWENGQATKIPLSGLVDTYKADELTLTLDNETKTFKIKEEYLTASNIKVDSSKTGTTATNVESALKELKEEIKSTADEVKDGVVTGIKGSNETDFRKGQVEITKENIGLGNVLNVGSYSKEESDNKYQVQGDYATRSEIPTTLPASDVYSWAKEPTKPSYDKSEIGLSNVDNTSDADKPISTATQQALDNVIEIAEGKTKTYVLEIANNEFFNSQEDSLYFSLTDKFVTIGGETISFGSLKIGDIILVIDLDVPDRYVGFKKQGEVLNFLYLYKLETQKVDLSGFALKTDLDTKQDVVIINTSPSTKVKDIYNGIAEKLGSATNGTTLLKTTGYTQSLGLITFGYIGSNVKHPCTYVNLQTLKKKSYTIEDTTAVNWSTFLSETSYPSTVEYATLEDITNAVPTKTSQLENDSDFTNRENVVDIVQENGEVVDDVEIESVSEIEVEDTDEIETESTSALELEFTNNAEIETVNSLEIEDVNSIDIGTSVNYDPSSDTQIPTTKAVQDMIDVGGGSGDYLPLSGGTMTGSIVMDNPRIGISNYSGSSIWGFNDGNEPCILNKTGRYIAIATDELDGDYIYYQFPEYEGEVVVKNDDSQTVDLGSTQIVNCAGIVDGGSPSTSPALLFSYIEGETLITTHTYNDQCGALSLGTPSMLEYDAFHNLRFPDTGDEYGDGSNNMYDWTLPSKSGTIALLEDIPVKLRKENYFDRVYGRDYFTDKKKTIAQRINNTPVVTFTQPVDIIINHKRKMKKLNGHTTSSFLPLLNPIGGRRILTNKTELTWKDILSLFVKFNDLSNEIDIIDMEAKSGGFPPTSKYLIFNFKNYDKENKLDRGHIEHSIQDTWIRRRIELFANERANTSIRFEYILKPVTNYQEIPNKGSGEGDHHTYLTGTQAIKIDLVYTYSPCRQVANNENFKILINYQIVELN